MSIKEIPVEISFWFGTINPKPHCKITNTGSGAILAEADGETWGEAEYKAVLLAKIHLESIPIPEKKIMFLSVKVPDEEARTQENTGLR